MPKSHCMWMCDNNEKMILFQSQEQCVDTQAEADQKTLGENTNYSVKLLCASLHVLYYCRNTSYEGGTAGVVTRPWACLFPCASKRFFSPPNHSDWLGTHTASYSVGTGRFFLHLHVEPPLRMSGAIPLLRHMCLWHARGGLLQLSVCEDCNG